MGAGGALASLEVEEVVFWQPWWLKRIGDGPYSAYTTPRSAAAVLDADQIGDGLLEKFRQAKTTTQVQPSPV